MKKFYLILVIAFFCVSVVPTGATGADSVKVENVKQDIVKAIDSTINDSAAMAQIAQNTEQALEDMPEKGASGWTWFAWIFGIVYFIAGIVASHYPTKKSLWWLRLLPLIVEHFIIPKNKRLPK